MTVSLEELKNGTHLDRRVYKDVVPIASPFGVVSAILRQKCPKPDERDAYSWLVDAINSLTMESRPETSVTTDRKDETTLQTCADSTTNSLSDITVRLQRIQEENRELQTDLELAMSKLESLALYWNTERRNAGTPEHRNAGILKPGTQNYYNPERMKNKEIKK